MAFIPGIEFRWRQLRVSPVIGPEGALRVALWSILLAGAAYTTTDPDLWGHVRFGLDILRDGSIPRVDVYSFTSDRVWVNHEWLAEIIMAGAFRLGGDLGLILVKLATITATLLLVDSALRREAIDAPIVRDGAGAIALVLTMDQIRYVRPQLFSVVAFAALLWCLTAARQGKRRWLLLIPPLFIAWANLHGGWLVGGGVLAVWTLGVAIAGDRRLALWCAAAGAASLAGTLLTPYGTELWAFLRETVGFSRPDITEWNPIYAFGWSGWVRWGVSVALAAGAIVLGGRAARQPERIGCLIALSAAALMVIRLQAFLGLAVVFLAVPAVGRAYERARARAAASTRTGIRSATRAVALFVTAAAMVVVSINLSHLRINRTIMPAPGAVAFLNAQPPGSGRVLVWFDWGEYAIWHLAPRMRVSIDGRRETTYSASLQDRHLRFYFDAPGGSTLATDLAADYIWIPTSAPATRRLDAAGWQRLYQDSDSVIFGHAASRQSKAPALLATAAETGIFPGP